MGIGTGTAALIGGAIAGGGSVAGAALSSHAAGKAADTQSQAELQAAQLNKQAQDEALAEQQREFNIGQSNLKPYLDTGTAALGQLADFTKTPFTAPDINETNDPGLAFRLAEGQKALQKSQAAGGSALTGGAAKQLQRYSQDYASNEYQNVYNRAKDQYLTNYNSLAGLAGTGQQAANTLTANGQNNANAIANILQTGAAQQGQSLSDAATARASGYVGSANAINQGISGATSGLTNALLLSKILGVGGGFSGNYGSGTPIPLFG